MRNLLVLISILLLPLANATAQYLVQQRPLITVTATASVKANPDVVIYHLRYFIEIKSGSELYGEPTYENMFSFISVSNLEVKWGPEELVSPTKLSRKVVVIVKSIAKHRELLRELIKIRNLSIEEIEFRVDKLDELRSEARLLALEQAQINAQKIAQKLGQTVGKAYSIEDIPSPIIDLNQMSETGTKSQPKTETFSLPFILDNYIEFPGYITITAEIKASFELN